MISQPSPLNRPQRWDSHTPPPAPPLSLSSEGEEGTPFVIYSSLTLQCTEIQPNPRATTPSERMGGLLGLFLEQSTTLIFEVSGLIDNNCNELEDKVQLFLMHILIAKFNVF